MKADDAEDKLTVPDRTNNNNMEPLFARDFVALNSTGPRKLIVKEILPNVNVARQPSHKILLFENSKSDQNVLRETKDWDSDLNKLYYSFAESERGDLKKLMTSNVACSQLMLDQKSQELKTWKKSLYLLKAFASSTAMGIKHL